VADHSAPGELLMPGEWFQTEPGREYCFLDPEWEEVVASANEAYRRARAVNDVENWGDYWPTGLKDGPA
jgi:hypothetical protein